MAANEILSHAGALVSLVIIVGYYVYQYRTHKRLNAEMDAELVKAKSRRIAFPPCSACGCSRVGAYCSRCGTSKEQRETIPPGTIMARTAEGKLRPWKAGDRVDAACAILLPSNHLSYTVTPADLLARHGDRIVRVRDNYRPTA